MTNHTPQLAGAIPRASMIIYVHNRILDLRILFEKVKSLRTLQYQGIQLLELRILNLISEVEGIVVLPHDSAYSAINRALMKYKKLQFIFDELENPSAARPPLSKFDGKFLARHSNGAADEI